MSAAAPDFYTLIHKAIRLAMSEHLVHLGSTDAADPVEWAAAHGRWRQIKRLLDAHSRHEDEHIHPLIHRAAPAIAAMLDGQHEDLDDKLAAIDTMMTEVADEVDGNFRRLAAREIYLRFSGFMALYFQHLIEEETEAMPALVDGIAVEEMFAAHFRLLGSMPPEQKLGDLPIIARSLSSPERVDLMTATQAGAPPAFFAEACRIMEESIGPAAFAAVAAAISRKAA
jgi:hypothetical protein